MQKPYSIIKLEQGTAEWLKWRVGGIGASDAPIIVGENPWKSVEELLREKLHGSSDQEKNPAMQKGTELEPEARKKYCITSGKSVRPACLESLQYNWLRASVDGITESGDAVVEIKCGVSVYRKTAITGRPPGYYYGQLQHILMVTGLSEIDFWCYLPSCREILLCVRRDQKYIDRLFEAEMKFWQKVQGVPPQI